MQIKRDVFNSSEKMRWCAKQIGLHGEPYPEVPYLQQDIAAQLYRRQWLSNCWRTLLQKICYHRQFFPFYICTGPAGKQCAGVSMLRRMKDVAGRAVFHHFPTQEHKNIIGHICSEREIV